MRRVCELVRFRFALVALVVGCRAPAPSSDGGVTFVAVGVAASATSTAPPASSSSALPAPHATYASVEDAQRDGAKAFGKTLLLRAWRGSVDETTVTLHPCSGGTGTTRELFIATYPAALRPLVRGVRASPPPSEACGATSDGCSRVLLRIRGQARSSDSLAGDLEAVLEAAPREPRRIAGADYGSLDDADLDGARAPGKIARLRVYRTEVEPGTFWAHPCEEGLHALEVAYAPSQRSAVDALSTSGTTCDTIDVKLSARHGATWRAELRRADP